MYLDVMKKDYSTSLICEDRTVSLSSELCFFFSNSLFLCFLSYLITLNIVVGLTGCNQIRLFIKLLTSIPWQWWTQDFYLEGADKVKLIS